MDVQTVCSIRTPFIRAQCLRCGPGLTLRRTREQAWPCNISRQSVGAARESPSCRDPFLHPWPWPRPRSAETPTGVHWLPEVWFLMPWLLWGVGSRRRVELPWHLVCGVNTTEEGEPAGVWACVCMYEFREAAWEALETSPFLGRTWLLWGSVSTLEQLGLIPHGVGRLWPLIWKHIWCMKTSLRWI